MYDRQRTINNGDMRTKEIIALLSMFYCFVIGCTDQQSKQALLIAHTTEKYLETGVPVCYLNEKGDTVIPFGKYLFCQTDIIRNIGFVYEAKKEDAIVCIDSSGDKLFNVFLCDNGADYLQEGFFRMVNDEGLIGYADSLGNVVIKPQYLYAFPFKDGKAKVTYKGSLKEVSHSCGEHSYWDSDAWYYIDKQGKRENAIIGGADGTTTIFLTDNSEKESVDRDTVIYELPQCQLWQTRELPQEYKGKQISMWTEYKKYWENVPVVNVFVTNPTDIPLDFGRRWNLYVWKDGKYDSPEMKVPYLMWEDDLFVSEKAPLLYCFRFPVGEYYHLPTGKYRITKTFGQKGKSIDLHADFEIK